MVLLKKEKIPRAVDTQKDFFSYTYKTGDIPVMT
jgi:hypothetical protein